MRNPVTTAEEPSWENFLLISLKKQFTKIDWSKHMRSFERNLASARNSARCLFKTPGEIVRNSRIMEGPQERIRKECRNLEKKKCGKSSSELPRGSNLGILEVITRGILERIQERLLTEFLKIPCLGILKWILFLSFFWHSYLDFFRVQFAIRIIIRGNLQLLRVRRRNFVVHYPGRGKEQTKDKIMTNFTIICHFIILILFMSSTK